MLVQPVTLGKTSFNTIAKQIGMGLVLLAFVGLGEYVGVVRPVLRLGERLATPVFHLAENAVFAWESPYKTMIEARSASRKIQDLELRYSEALAQLGQLAALQEENQALRELIENTDRKDRQVLVSVPIISRALPAINAGSRDGVRVGDEVLAAMTLVGIIESTTPSFSSVRLLSQSDQFPIVVVTEAEVEGVVVGDGRKVILTEVSPEANLEVGQRVVTAGQANVERDIFVGTISKVIDNDSAPIKQAVIEQLVDFDQARVVEVYLGPEPE